MMTKSQQSFLAANFLEYRSSNELNAAILTFVNEYYQLM